MRRTNPNYIVCIVDPTDNCYDYETAGAWTDELETIELWLHAGIQQFVLLDPLSMELVASYDAGEMECYINGIKDEWAE